MVSRMWQPAADNYGWDLKKKVRQTAITICSWMSHSIGLLSRIVYRGQEGPKGSKVTFRPDFQANTRYRKKVESKSRYS
jgi:hypothetical protein